MSDSLTPSKRNRDSTDTSESSFELSTARRAELIKKAKKRARSVRNSQSQQFQSTIFSHFNPVASRSPVSSASVSDITSGMATGSRDGSANGTEQRQVSLEDIMTKLCSVEVDLKKELQGVRTSVEELKGDVFDLKKENDNLREELGDLKTKCSELETQVEEARFLANYAAERQNECEQNSRRNNVRFFGIPEPPGEKETDCEQAVLKVIRESLGLNMNPSHIEASHRLGLKTGKGIRPIIVKFVSRKAAEDILKRRKLLKGTKVVVQEDLTKSNHILLNLCLDHPGVQDAWSMRGGIFIKGTVNQNVKRIEKSADLKTVPLPSSSSTPLTARQRRKQKAAARVSRAEAAAKAARPQQSPLSQFGSAAAAVVQPHQSPVSQFGPAAAAADTANTAQPYQTPVSQFGGDQFGGGFGQLHPATSTAAGVPVGAGQPLQFPVSQFNMGPMGPAGVQISDQIGGAQAGDPNGHSPMLP